MAKKRTLNELRQEKNYGYRAPFGMTHEEEPKGYSEIDVETTKELIISTIKENMFDELFQTVCDEMEKHEVFQTETYFTPQGFEEFDDAWFEFYHEHHGDILSTIMKKFTN